uniref:Large ribosomal subunit protein P1 n=1 Tax=Suricata suricatta TaxID=37032 RepID=A0A673UML8_SURSU
MAASLGLPCIYSALNLHHNAVTVTQDKNNALIEAAGVNVESFWLGLFAKAPANVNIGSPICNVGGGGPSPEAGVASVEGPTPSTLAGPAGVTRWKQRKKNQRICHGDFDNAFL